MIEPQKGRAGFAYEFNDGSYNQPLDPDSFPYVKQAHTLSIDIGPWSFNWGEERIKEGLAPAGAIFNEMLANTLWSSTENTNYKSTGFDNEDQDIKTQIAI